MVLTADEVTFRYLPPLPKRLRPPLLRGSKYPPYGLRKVEAATSWRVLPPREALREVNRGRVEAKDTAELNQTIEAIRGVKGVASTLTSIVLKSLEVFNHKSVKKEGTAEPNQRMMVLKSLYLLNHLLNQHNVKKEGTAEPNQTIEAIRGSRGSPRP